MDKKEGPATSISFLGILFDTQAMQLRLPTDKYLRIMEELSKWSTRKACTKRELLSLIGLLQHASFIVKTGRTFLRHLIDLAKRFHTLDHPIRLVRATRSDILWWLCFLKDWNGCQIIPAHE